MSNLTPIRNQQLQNSKTGETTRPDNPSKVQLLRMADGDRKIAQCTEEQIKSVLKYVFVLLGLNEKDVPDDYEKTVLLEFIYATYGHLYSPVDIRNAFVLALAGDFEVDKEIYGKRFSPLYLSRFMTAYGKYKQRTLSVQPKQIDEVKSVVFSEEKEDTLLEFVAEYCKTNLDTPIFFPVQECYNAITRKGYVMEFTGTTLREVTRHRLAKESSAAYGIGNFRRYKEIEKIMNDDKLMELEDKRTVVTSYFDGVVLGQRVKESRTEERK